MPTKSQDRLTKRTLDAAVPRDQEFSLWDSEVRGFGVRIKPSGTKSFVLKYRNASGQQRKITIGQYGQLTLEQARKLARKHLGVLAAGTDPYADLQPKAHMTVQELCEMYFADAEAGKVLYRGKAKKLSTVAIDHGRIHRHIVPLLGNKRIKRLTRHEVEAFMFNVIDGKTSTTVKTKLRGVARVRGGPGTAKKCVSLLGAIYSYAIRKGYAEHNPCRDVDKPADGVRNRFLTEDEYGRLGQALTDVIEHKLYGFAPRAIVVAALTGCRKSEVLSLVGSTIDVDGKCLRLTDTKTGPQMRPCGAVALAICEDTIAQSDTGWVFPAQRGDGHLVNIRKPMAALCQTANVEGVTPHVLRHSFATVAHELGYSELTIAGLLGHRAGSVTGRYAHHVDHALSDAADRVCGAIWMRLGSSLHNVLQIQLES